MGICLLAITCCLSKTILQKNKRNSVKLCHTKPFLQNRDRVTQMLSLKDNSEKKNQTDKLCPYQIVLKNEDKTGQMLLSKTILNKLIQSNLNLSIPYKTGFYKTETVSDNQRSKSLYTLQDITATDYVKFCHSKTTQIIRQIMRFKLCPLQDKTQTNTSIYKKNLTVTFQDKSKTN